MPDSKHKEEIFIESFSWGASNTANEQPNASDLKPPPLNDAEQAAGGGPHVKVFDGTTTPADESAIGGANGGVWKTTNFDPGDGAANSGGANFALADGSVRSISQSAEDDGAASGLESPGDGSETAADHKQWVPLEPVGPILRKPGGGAASEPEHEIEYQVVAGKAPPEAPDGLATGGPEDQEARLDGFLKVPDIPGESARSAPSVSEIVVTKHSDYRDGDIEDLATPAAPPEPAVEIFLKLPDGNGEADDTSGAGGHVGGGGGGAGKVSWGDFSFSEPQDGPSSLSALEPEEPDAAYLEMKLQAVKVTSYSINGAGLDDATDEPSTIAALEPDSGPAEATYHKLTLENASISSYSMNSAGTDDEGGTQEIDDWEDAL